MRSFLVAAALVCAALAHADEPTPKINQETLQRAVGDAELWAGARRMGMLLRRSPVGVVLARTTGDRHVVKTGPGVVTVVGEPGELVLFAFGRDAVRVELQGEPGDVEALTRVPRGV